MCKTHHLSYISHALCSLLILQLIKISLLFIYLISFSQDTLKIYKEGIARWDSFVKTSLSYKKKKFTIYLFIFIIIPTMEYQYQLILTFKTKYSLSYIELKTLALAAIPMINSDKREPSYRDVCAIFSVNVFRSMFQLV